MGAGIFGREDCGGGGGEGEGEGKQMSGSLALWRTVLG